jgi:hypothetical protein
MTFPCRVPVPFRVRGGSGLHRGADSPLADRELPSRSRGYIPAWVASEGFLNVAGGHSVLTVPGLAFLRPLYQTRAPVVFVVENLWKRGREVIEYRSGLTRTSAILRLRTTP